MFKKLNGAFFKSIKFLIFDFYYKFFRLVFRLVLIINSRFSIYLNLRLLFVPMYGDSSFIGRILSFFIRLVEVIFGLFLSLIFIVCSLFLFSLYLYLHVFFINSSLLAVLIIYYFLFFTIIFINSLYRPLISVVNNSAEFLYYSYDSNVLSLTKNVSEDFFIFIQNLLHTKNIQLLLKCLEIPTEEFVSIFKNNINPLSYKLLNDKLYNFSKSNGFVYVYDYVVFLMLLNEIKSFDSVFSKYGYKIKDFNNCVSYLFNNSYKDTSLFSLFKDDFVLAPFFRAGKGSLGRKTPILDTVSEDLTSSIIKSSDFVFVNRTQELNLLISMLGNIETSNILLVGEVGFGKLSLIKKLALLIALEEVPKHLLYKRVISIDSSKLLAGKTSLGEVLETLKTLFNEVKDTKDVILVFNNIQSFSSGFSSNNDISIVNFLAENFFHSNIKIILTTDNNHYRTIVQPNKELDKVLQKVYLEELNIDNTFEILLRHATNKKIFYGVVFTYTALKQIITDSAKFIKDDVFPTKALKVLERCTAVTTNELFITKDIVDKAVQEISKIPISDISKDSSKALLELEENLNTLIIGQPMAIKTIVTSLIRASAGLRDENKPLASFLFVGSTGVGKTQTAKFLSEVYFKNKNMLRLDMSEYQQLDSIDKLIGTPDGSKGGLLTNFVLDNPYSLILLDEIEKAHHDILLLFLQVLDDGRLTDTKGKTVSFTNTIVIATSNAGSKSIQKLLDANDTLNSLDAVVMSEIKNTFAPEFLNRFSSIVVYKPLNKEDAIKIITLMLDKVKIMAANKNINLSFSTDLIAYICDKSFNVSWGARNFQREIETVVETYLAKKMLSEDLKAGDSITLGVEVYKE